MINSMLGGLDTALMLLFAAGALIGALLMIVLRQPMRVATALISTMVFLGGIYGLLGVHFIAAFQVLIYVGAVMVFMVYVIMLIDAKDSAFARFSRVAPAGIALFVLLTAALVYAVAGGSPDAGPARSGAFGVQAFSAAFLNEYWLYFELISLLLVAAVVAAIAVVRIGGPRRG